MLTDNNVSFVEWIIIKRAPNNCCYEIDFIPRGPAGPCPPTGPCLPGTPGAPLSPHGPCGPIAPSGPTKSYNLNYNWFEM